MVKEVALETVLLLQQLPASEAENFAVAIYERPAYWKAAKQERATKQRLLNSLLPSRSPTAATFQQVERDRRRR